jgi:hypothetical protein
MEQQEIKHYNLPPELVPQIISWITKAEGNVGEAIALIKKIQTLEKTYLSGF